MAIFVGNVRDSQLSLRASTSTNSTRYLFIPVNTSLTLETVNGANDWFKTTYNGYTGYVVARYIAITNDGGTAKVTTASGSLNVRVLPNGNAERISQAPQYSILRLLDYTSVSGWYRVSSSAGTGWAMSQYLTIQTYPGVTPAPDPDPTPTGDSIPAPANQITAYLAMNNSNDANQVRYLQTRLNQLKYYCGAVDGVFGKNVEWAVKYFQKRNNLTADGIVGTNTRAALNASGSNCSTAWGLDASVRNWMPGDKPQQWFMNGSEAMWANEPFPANASGTQTIGDSGNCPTSFAMIASTLLKTAITPAHVCKFVIDEGHRDPTGNTGVLSSFFAAAAAKYGLTYVGSVTGMANIKSYVDQGYLALMRIVGSDQHQLCSPNGATYFVVYYVDDVVKVLNPNANTQTYDHFGYNVWADADWVREAHIYRL